MKLYQPVVDKIKELGETKAAEYFGKSRQTLYSWSKTPSKIPLAVVQKMIDDGLVPNEVTLTEKIEPFPSDVVTITTTDHPIPVVNQTGNWTSEVEARLDKLEDFARTMTDPDLKAPPASLVRPTQIVQPTIVPETPAEVRQPEMAAVGEIPVNTTPQTLPEGFGQGWNTPYAPKK